MESIGQKLISARETLGFSIEQIARETNIAKSYLTALEAEDFDSFPGETYLLGFLRNYSEYLGLDPEDMVTLYRNMRIQEQPAPIEELLDKHGSIPKPVLIIIIIILVLGLGSAGYFYIYPNYIQGKVASPVKVETEAEAEEPPAVETKINVRDTYEFADEVLEKRFNKHDAISVLLKGSNYRLVIADIAEEVTFIHPQGELVMKAGEEALVDLDGDSSADIRILLRNADADQGSLVVHVDRFVQSSAPSVFGSATAEPAAVSSAELRAGDPSPTGNAGAPSRVVDTFVVRNAASAEPFTLNIVFRGYCLFRYDSDSSAREERYFHKGETFRLDVNSNIRIWVSNAGALSAKVNGVDINLGGSGEISARTIKWVYNSTSARYELQLIPVY